MKAQALRNLIFYFVFLLSLSACEKNKNEITLAIENATVITMNGEEVLEGYTLLISGETIIDIIPAKQWKTRHNLETIDATGKFIIPALTDMHVHYVPANDNILPLFLSYGVTSLRFMAGNVDLLHLRDSIQQNQILLPDFYIASQLIDGDPPAWGEQHNGPIVTEVNKVEEVIDEQMAMGYDFLKVYSSLSPEVFSKIIKIANEKGIRVTGHLPGSLDNENLFPASFDIQHLSGYARFAAQNEAFRAEVKNSSYDITLDKEAALNTSEMNMKRAAKITKDNKIWNCPTLVLFYNRSNEELCDTLKRFKELEKLGGLVNWWESLGCEVDSKTLNLVEFQHKMITELHHKGNKLLAGTDFPNPWIIPGKSLHQELERFVASGLSNYEALKTATVNPAEWLGTLDKKGTLQPGMAADMILLHKNPLEDILNTQSISKVIFKGKILNQPVE
jgi:hypothetical protein